MRNAAHRNHLIRDGILRAIYARMKADTRVVLMGEGAHVKQWYDCRALHDEFPERILTLPISEDSNANFALGCAIAGMVPVVDVITADFGFRCFDAICNTLAKHETVDRPRTIVVRMEHLTGGPTTGQRWESMFARVPGLSVCVPSNPSDARRLMETALTHPGVTLFFEDREIPDENTPEEKTGGMMCMPQPFGKAWLHRGERLTVVSYGLCLRRIVDDERMRVFDLIDLRTLYPLDMPTILESTCRTGRLLVVEPAIRFGGIGAEIIAQVATREPGIRCQRLGAERATIPTAREHHEGLYPSAAQVLAVAERMVSR
jgi:pyruvate/2-oxoglutarate/acetoin dehydrogenase E1 component